MRLKRAIATAVSAAILLAVPAWGGDTPRYVAACLLSDLSPNPCGADRLEVNFKAKISPERLSRHEFAPVGLTVSGTIGTEHGGHPPALREAMVVVDEGVRLDTKGLGSCPRRRLENVDFRQGRSACREAIVGRGVARIGLASSETTLKTPLTLFNGGASSGETRLFVRGATGDALVAVGKVRRRGKGLQATWKVPRILEGDGSLLSFRLKIWRVFATSGWRHSYLSGSCPDGELRASVPDLTFVNEAQTPGVVSRTVLNGELSVPCVPER